MSLWKFIVRLFGGTPHVGGTKCPRCGFGYRWDGRRCEHCNYPGRLISRPSPRDEGGESASSQPSQASPSARASQTRRQPQAAAPASVASSRTPRPAPNLASLDPAQFTPMSDAAAFTAAGPGPLWGNPWFGRRDLIPPVTDKRTLLIDRAMVAHGYLTPEELVEIHEVGEQMDIVRPELLHASVIASRAVEMDQAAKDEIRKQKKAEAEARKQKHREAVEHRKATDIIFLGRGVSRGLADRRANIEKLGAANLPVLATPADIAKALELPIPRLRWLAFHSQAATRTHYVRFTVPKKSGGTRELAAPHQTLATAQEWILANILSKVPTHDAAHGFVPSRSTVTNALPHVGRPIVINADLKDFFPTITFPRVNGIFQQLGYSPAAATVLALLCTEAPRKQVVYAGKAYEVATGPRALPQGACTSPALSNLATRRMDARLAGITEKLGWTYTRYADDITFSSPAPGAEAKSMTGYLLARLRHIAQDEGFIVNEKKTRVQKPNQRQSVTGIVVNQRMGVPRRTVRRIRAILHAAKYTGLAAQNKQGHPHFEAWVRGMVAYINMVNPQQGRPLVSALVTMRP
ncbi:MAG: reverse transcriptase family protein [Phycisphaeraceae bacterium]